MVDCLIGFPHFGHGSLVNKVKDTVIFFRTGERTLKGVQIVCESWALCECASIELDNAALT